MTQASRPQADHITSYPAPSDPGPYSADQWAEYMQIAYTGDQQTTQGPLHNYLNELVCADNGSTTVTVGTGAGWVNGHLLISSEQETFTIPAGPVATRTDRVVMCENNTNTEITTTDAGMSFIFPVDLTEYTATPGIPPYSARLVIVRGADGAGLPVIDQTNTQYMVELYRYDIEATPTISNATDYRYFARYSHLGDYMKIDEAEPNNVATVTFSSIPQYYRHLQIVGIARTDKADVSDTLALRFNTDTGNNYDYLASRETHNATLSTTESFANNHILIGYVSAATAVAGKVGTFTIEIPHYRGATFHKQVQAYGSLIHTLTTGNIINWQNLGGWRSAAAITQIDILTSSLGGAGADFDNGSVFTLYGRR